MKFRPRFSPRMLFVIVAFVAIWLAWQTNIVRERKIRLVWIRNHGGEWAGNDFFAGRVTPKHVSWVRQLLGDQPVIEIVLAVNPASNEINQIQAEFPEALVKISGKSDRLVFP